MFYIVETVQQLQKLEIYRNKPSFIEVIPFYDKVYPKLGKPCLIYYRPLTSKKGFILPINHLESLSLSFSTILAFLESLEAEIWTIDRKTALHYGLGKLPLKGLKMAYCLTGNQSFPDVNNFNTAAHRFYHRKIKNRLDINRFIPISKHYEKFENLFKTLTFPENIAAFDFYNSKVVDNFYKIEQNGIGIDHKSFDEHFSDPKNKIRSFNKLFNTWGNEIYTEFIFFNNSARPTCKFNNISFLSLKKEDDSRNFIIPTNNILVEFDYKSYQVKLMSDLLGFKFHGNIHEILARQYYDIPIREKVTEYAYENAKKLTFRYMYARDEKYTGDIVFYKEIYRYRDLKWEEYKLNGYIKSPISGRRIYNITEMSQILPLLMQCIETERNTLIIEELNEYLKNFETKIVLYTYDAFLFDFSFNDGSEVIKNIKNIIEKDGFETTVKFGENYGELELFEPSEPIFI